ncbi:hemolysin family protein [Patescibacteria group bacterium]|nr:hemolysin family protein [Patescibacteria group bacterium]
MNYFTAIPALLMLLILSAFFSGSETALTALSQAKIRDLVSKKKKCSKYIETLKDNPTKLLVTILIGNNLVNIGAAAYATFIFTYLFGSSGIGIATGVMTFLVLVFGEIMPKSYAYKHSVAMSQVVSPVLYYLQIILYPLIWVFSRFVKSFVHKEGDDEKPKITEDELKAMVSIGAEDGAINRREQELIENILEFNDKKAEDVMTPRVKVKGIEDDFTLQDAMDYALAQNHTRYPVYKDSLDNIVGILSLKELVKLMNEHSPTVKLEKCRLKPVLHVPNFKKIHTLFRDFQKRREHIAVVLDEHGGTSGIITLEDLLEEIVGDIIDEHEVTEDQIKKIKKDEYMVSGDTLIEDICEELQLDLPEAYYRTVSYLILKKLGRFPYMDEKIEYPNFTIQVVEKSAKRIRQVVIKKTR